MKRYSETDHIESQLLAIGSRIRSQHSKQGLLRFVLYIGIGFLVLFAVDYMTDLPFILRIVLLVGYVLYILRHIKKRFIDKANEPIDEEEVSLILEKHYPELQSRLISTLQFQAKEDFGSGVSVNLIDGMIQQMFGMRDGFNFSAVIDRGWVKPLFKRLAIVALLIAGIVVLAPNFTLAFVQRLINPAAQYPTFTQIISVDLPDTIPEGDNFTLSVQGGGEIPDLGIARIVSSDGEQSIDLLPDTTRPGYFIGDLPAMTVPVNIAIVLGDASWGPKRVTPLPRPRMAKVSVQVTPPAYTGQESVNYETGNVRVLEGSTVTYTFETSKDLEKLEMRDKDGALIEPQPQAQDAKTFIWKQVITGSEALVIEMTDTDGLSGEDLPRYRISALSDRSPSIRMQRPSSSLELASVSQTALEFTVKDDIGLKDVRIRYHIHDEADMGGELKDDRDALLYQEFTNINDKEFTFEGVWQNKKVDVRPGYSVEFWVEATDIHPDGNLTKSGIKTISIITIEQMQATIWGKLGDTTEEIDPVIIEIKESAREIEDIKK